MSFFNKRRRKSQSARWYRDAAPARVRPVGPVIARAPAPAQVPPASLEAAREAVHEQAERSRAEIKALVAEERKEVADLIESGVRSSEERLRGVAENRIDLELERIRKAEDQLRAEIAKSVKVEVKQTIGQLRSQKKPAAATPSRSTGNGRGKAGAARRNGRSNSNGRVPTPS